VEYKFNIFVQILLFSDSEDHGILFYRKSEKSFELPGGYLTPGEEIESFIHRFLYKRYQIKLSSKLQMLFVDESIQTNIHEFKIIFGAANPVAQIPKGLISLHSSKILHSDATFNPSKNTLFSLEGGFQ